MYLMQFEELYGSGDAPRQTARYIRMMKGYEELFGLQEVCAYSAPGRTEIAGNHTDHQQGQVIAAAVSRDVAAVVAPRDDLKVWLYSEGYGAMEIDLHELEPVEEEKETTASLIRGVAAGMQKRQHLIGGFNAYVSSEVISGSGLSSSAAFETLIGTIFSGLYNDDLISAEEIALIGQYAENIYFGKPCGLMDQMACSVGSACRIEFGGTPKVTRLEMDPSAYGYVLCITDTKGSHADLTGEYAAVPMEMKSVAMQFGRSVLGDLTQAELLERAPEIREACGDRAFLRALHYVRENGRVGDMADALANGDFPGFLKLVQASGDSSYKYLQNVYTTQDVEHQNVSVALAVSEAVLGEDGVARVHGGGFAGTIQAYVRKEALMRYQEAMEGLFGEGACQVYRIRKFGGVRVL
ncbi:MAG: galactokinase [Mogibacterium sp.]|nr:galactokinase [Mogibacterium sp.]